MKKTRYEKFMLATTKTAMSLVELDTFEDHLAYTKLMIDVELLKIGKKEKSEKKKTTTKATTGKLERISNGLGTARRTLIRIGVGLEKVYGFLTTGNNLVIVVVGSLFLYAALVMALELI